MYIFSDIHSKWPWLNLVQKNALPKKSLITAGLGSENIVRYLLDYSTYSYTIKLPNSSNVTFIKGNIVKVKDCILAIFLCCVFILSTA